MMQTLVFVGIGTATGAGLAWWRWDAQAIFDTLPCVLASALLAWCFAWLIWPVLPAVWSAGHYREAAGSFVASLLPALVGLLVDPNKGHFEQARLVGFVGCALVGFCFIGYPFLVNLI